MKLIKKSISMLLALIIMVSINNYILAKEDDENIEGSEQINFVNEDNENIKGNEQIIIVNEYDIIKVLKEMSDEELKKEGYSQEEVDEIKSIDFDAILKELKNKSINELENRGYNSTKIKSIKEYDGTEEMARAVAATLTASIKLNSFSYDSNANKTYFANSLSWAWNEMPFFTFHDIVAASVSEGLYFHTSSLHSVKYYDPSNYNTYLTTKTYSMVPQAPTGCMSNTFDVNLYNSPNSPKGVAKIGYAYFYWTKLGKVDEVGGIIQFGHTVLGITPSINIGGDGISFSFTPSSSVQTLFSDFYHYYR